ncbi:unnamed protein product, partial [Discosporangium mesarthrocarpum]
HHKSKATLQTRNVLTRVYYSNLPFFGYCCVGTELFYVVLYLLNFVPQASVGLGSARVSLRSICMYVFMPACVCKQVINVAQMLSAARSLTEEA